MPKSRIDHIEENARPKRVPLFDQPRNILTVTGKRAGYEYRWFNDVDNRIERAKLGGWDHVTYEELAQVGDVTAHSTRVSPKDLVSRKVGGTDMAFLMCIPKELYEEDQAAKQRQIDELEAQMFSQAEEEGLYGKIKQERGK
jgi:hypothetical protein